MTTEIYEVTVLGTKGELFIILPQEWILKNKIKEGDKIGLSEFEKEK